MLGNLVISPETGRLTYQITPETMHKPTPRVPGWLIEWNLLCDTWLDLVTGRNWL